MLVHKKSLGVLEFIWNERGDSLVPATFESGKIYGITPEEWWYVKYGTKLFTLVRLNYPNFEPVIDPSSGELVDIVCLAAKNRGKEKRMKKQMEMEEKTINARNRGYEMIVNTAVQPDSLAFLGPTLRRKRR